MYSLDASPEPAPMLELVAVADGALYVGSFGTDAVVAELVRSSVLSEHAVVANANNAVKTPEHKKDNFFMKSST